MKKTVVFLSLAAILLSGNIAFAKEGRREDVKVKHQNKMNFKLGLDRENDRDRDIFLVIGKVKSVSGNQLVLSIDHSAKMESQNNTFRELTVETDSKTKFRVLGKKITLTDIKVGFDVIVKGEKKDSVHVADWVQVRVEKQKLMGEVTAKTDTTVTIKNNVTGAIATVPVTEDTKVNINGETKALADVQVGDKGMVKVRALLGTIFTKMIQIFK